jgi:hypothetical protein
MENSMMRHNLWLILLALLVASAHAQDLEPRYLVDSPTAGIMPRGTYAVDLRMEPEGGLLAGVSVGLMSRLFLGVSYGGQGIVGHGTPDWNPRVEFHIRYRLLDETGITPALALGFDSQGYGPYREDRYRIKSKGFYGVLSKAFQTFAGITTSLHAGGNYSLEIAGDDKIPSLFCGLQQSINPEIEVVAEYETAWNDDTQRPEFGQGHGYANAGVRWFFADRLSFQVDFRNLSGNGTGMEAKVNRTLQITFLQFF